MTNIFLYAVNDRDFMKKMQALSCSIKKRIMRGERVESVLLSESSVVKKIVWAVCKYAKNNFDEFFTIDEKRKARMEIAKRIIDDAEE